VSWSATSEPAGKASRYCLDHQREEPGRGLHDFATIIETGTTCATVYRAIDAGAFMAAPPPNNSGPPVFTTAGWTCSRAATSGRYTCTRSSTSFSWVEGL
jgi:hypothetical protein